MVRREHYRRLIRSYTKLSLLSLIFLCSAAAAKNLFVYPDSNLQGSQQSPSFTTIQSAIDSAIDGDIILLQPGTYRGPGNYDLDTKGSKITIQSTNPLGLARSRLILPT